MNLVLVGHPVDHSLSPVLHRTAFAALGVVGTYNVRDVDDDGVAGVFDEIRSGELDGANVTMPHKHVAAALVDDTTDDVALTGAANTVVRVDDRLVGHNTDIGGIKRAWVWGALPTDRPVALLGAGGAAAAALVALDDVDVTVHARRRTAADELVQRVGSGRAAEWGPPPTGSVVVNATPVGMEDDMFPAEWIDDAAGVFDMPYAASDTRLIVHAGRLGVPTATGRDMLLGQAVESFWLWTGRTAPLAAMREALLAASSPS